jgi:hypothetical protein
MSQVIINANAGAQITAEFHRGTGGAVPTDPEDPIASSHKGMDAFFLAGCCSRFYLRSCHSLPVSSILQSDLFSHTFYCSAKVPSALQTTVTGLQWFKIYQDGYSNSTGLWAVDTLIANKGKVTFPLPSCIPAGQYLLRVEIIGTLGQPAIYRRSRSACATRTCCSDAPFLLSSSPCRLDLPRCPVLRASSSSCRRRPSNSRNVSWNARSSRSTAVAARLRRPLASLARTQVNTHPPALLLLSLTLSVDRH